MPNRTKAELKKHYAEYQGTPAQIKKRSQRNAARRAMVKKHGEALEAHAERIAGPRFGIVADGLEGVHGLALGPRVGAADHHQVLPVALVHACLRRHLDDLAAEDELDEVLATVVTMADITERKAAQDQIRSAKEELEVRVYERTADLARTNLSLRREITERERVRIE
jgi:hypothetical protein